MAYGEKRTYDKSLRKWKFRGRYKLPDGKYGSVKEDDLGQPFYSKESAKQFAAGLETDVRRKTHINPRDGKIPMGEWADIWMDSIHVGPLTERKYRGRLKSVILPHWRHVPVRDVTAVAYNTWENQLRSKGYKANSISGYRSVLRLMMEDAVASRMRADNPIPSRKGSRRGKYTPKPKADGKVIATPRQALLVARNALTVRGPELYALVLTTAYTGMRIGELAGLTRDRLKLHDRDGTGARILLEFQSQYVGGAPALIPAKYGSERGLIIPPFLAALLKELIDSHDSEFVFTAPWGGRLLIAGHFYKRSWDPCADGRAPLPAKRGRHAQPGVRPVLGVEGLRPHGLRHSHKVWLDECGHPRVAVEERLGHDLPGVEGVYSHTTLAMELKIAESLQSLWEDSLRPVVDRREFGPIPLPEDQTAG